MLQLLGSTGRFAGPVEDDTLAIIDFSVQSPESGVVFWREEVKANWYAIVHFIVYVYPSYAVYS